MTAGWAMVYSSNQSYEVEWVKSLLADQGIDSIIMNKQDAAYLIGEFEVYVATGDVLEARQIIIQFKGE
jgi:hypothetical protein